MSKLFVSIVLSLVFGFLGTSIAKACDCYAIAQGAPWAAFKWYDVIFIGRVEKNSAENQEHKVAFSIEKSIRGITDLKKIEMFTESCTPFKEGERYFVYLRRDQNGKLSESMCSPTKNISEARTDLEYLEDLEAGRSGTRIFGYVREDTRKNYDNSFDLISLPGIEVTITSQKNKFKTQTDKSGYYTFRNIPPGRYRVRAKLPGSKREIAYKRNLLKHYVNINNDFCCAFTNFTATSQPSITWALIGTIKGKIIGQNGEIPVQQQLSLLRLDEKGNVMPYRAPLTVWSNRENGEFLFDFVPEGKYLLSINPQNCPYPKNGFPTMYFPGLADKSGSKIIEMKEGRKLKLGDFRILPMLKERRFAGTVFFADKTPAANVKVRLLDGNPNNCNNFWLNVKTDEAGHFSLQGFETYEYRIDAVIEGKKWVSSKPIILPQTGNIEDIHLILEKPL